MAAKETFSKRLRELRGKTSAKELSESSGVALSAIYNAESEVPVSWKTVEKAYAPLCPSRESLIHLLTLWALTQTLTPLPLYSTKDMMNALVREEAEQITTEDAEILKEMALMTLPDRRSLLLFAKHYRKNPAARRMVGAWMESVG
jgi:methylthioribose-1-phosphate isomerase